MLVCVFCFFFFKQKTAYEMRISDWSSDVCSSDLWFHRLFRDFERDDTGNDQRDTKIARERTWIAEVQNANHKRAGGTDAGPDGVRGTDRDFPLCEPQHVAAQRHQPDRDRDAEPAALRLLRQLQADRPADLEQAREQQVGPAHRNFSACRDAGCTPSMAMQAGAMSRLFKRAEEHTSALQSLKRNSY